MTRSVASGLLILVLVGCGRGATRPSESRPASTPAPVQEEVGPLTEAVAVRPPGPVTQIRGQAPSLAFGRDERLWVAFEEDGLVKVASSWDFGTSFTHPVTVNSEPEKVEINGENRPKIQLGDDDTVYVSWTRKLPGRFTGDVRFSRSIDGGTTFEAPRTINDDGLQIGHRFESLGVDALGHIYLAWIDKRDRGPARQRGEAYRGAAVYSAVSTDRGQNFAENQRVAPHACECCRIAMAPAPDGGVAVLWRHIFEPNVRDHAFAIVGPEGVESEMRRATFEGWKLDGCPHHGPSLAPTVDQVGYHATWFSAADGTARVFYGRFDAGGGLVADPIEVASGVPAAHPSLAVHGPRVHLVWKAVADGVTEVILQTSVDGGVNWLPPEPVLSTTGASDHPLLFSHAEHAVLSWRTDVEGLRIASLG